MRKPRSTYTPIVGPMLYGGPAMHEQGCLKFQENLIQTSGWRDRHRYLRNFFLSKIRPHRTSQSSGGPKRRTKSARASSARKGSFTTIELVDNAPPSALDALQALQLLQQIREHARLKDFDSMMAAAFDVGRRYERTHVRRHEPIVEVGQKVREGGRLGSEKAYGTAEAKRSRQMEMFLAVQTHVNRGMKLTAAYRKVAEAYDVCEKTVRRACRKMKAKYEVNSLDSSPCVQGDHGSFGVDGTKPLEHRRTPCKANKTN